jgi:PGF-pre-PGF domain-containing protein
VWQIKRVLSILFTVALALQAIAGSAAATTLYVDDDGSGNYTTIQDALTDAVDGDTIIVNPGTYPNERVQVDVPVTIKGASEYPSIGGFDLYATSHIEGLTITKGIDFDRAGTACTIRNNRFEDCGVSMGSSYLYGDQTIINNLFTGSSAGVSTFDSINNKITGNTFQNCKVGIAFTWGGGSHVVTGNTFKNCNIGIQLIDDTATIYNNYFYNKVNLQIDEGASCTLNTAKTAGKNIIGGPYIGGNFWSTPEGNGFSDTRLDTNGDGIAEEAYQVTEGVTDYLPLVTPRTEPGPTLPAANFKANITQGPAPLAVQFTDISQNATSRNWDFDNDGKVDSTAESEVHVYTDKGTYTVNLTAINVNGTTSKTAVITVLEKRNDVFPAADFSTNVSSGNAPLSVLFTDLSKNATSRSWDINNDGVEDSNEASFVYEYASAGTYTAKLTAINANGTNTKTMTIAVEEKSSGGSSGGSSHKSSGGSSGGGGGGSPEPAKNVEVKELSQVFITNGKAVKFDFTKNATCVVYVGFDAIKNVGKTTTIVEQLKNKSALVSELPSGEVYKSFNVWVGNSGYATSKNIKNPVISFKVEKAWIQDNKIDQASVTLYRYEEKVWVQLPASLSGEDEKYLYFTAEVPGYASFAITGKSLLQVQDENSQIPAENRSVGALSSEENGTEEAEPDESSRNSNTLLSVGIVTGALVVAGVVLKSMKK